MENRLSNLQSATVYLESFLHILSDYKVLLPMEEKCFEMYAKTHRLMEIRWVKHQKTLQGVALRELKINRLRNERVSESIEGNCHVRSIFLMKWRESRVGEETKEWNCR